MPDHLSVSQIKTFHCCPMQYEFSYIKGIKTPPAGVLIQGSAYHKAVGADLEYKMGCGTTLRDKDIIDIVSDSFDFQIKSNTTEEEDNVEKIQVDKIDWGDDTPGNAKDVTTRLALLYHQTMALEVKPILVEERQEIEISGIKFVLITDVITEEKIIDHKLIARRYDQGTLERDIQVTAYTYLHHKPFEFHQALKQKNPMIEPALCTRTEKDWKFFEMLVDSTNKAIQSGIFYPNPNGYHCSEDYCGYFNMCRGKN